jgi:hypothetical protein
MLRNVAASCQALILLARDETQSTAVKTHLVPTGVTGGGLGGQMLNSMFGWLVFSLSSFFRLATF